jgi:hypothetical protein
MTVGVSRRAVLEIVACGVSLALAIVVALTLLQVRGWERALVRGDARFGATPLPPTFSPTGAPPKLPPAMFWELPHGFGATVAEDALGVRDDIAFRRALALYRAALPNPNEQQQLEFDRELPAKRILAQRAAAAVSTDDPDPLARSRAANMLGILIRGQRTPSDPAELRAQILKVIGLFRSAIKLDPDNDEAKLNLELVLRDPQTDTFVGTDPSGTASHGNRGGTGEAGAGY